MLAVAILHTHGNFGWIIYRRQPATINGIVVSGAGVRSPAPQRGPVVKRRHHPRAALNVSS